MTNKSMIRIKSLSIPTGAFVLLLACSGLVFDEARTFSTPEEGVSALIKALKPLDQKELHAILGPEADDIVSSGDELADRKSAEAFVAKYERRHIVVTKGDTAVIEVGDDEWPMPIPLVKTGDKWKFDTAEGKEEILARRIGRNELSTIQTCRAIVDAQDEFSAMNKGTDTNPVYAQKFRSDPGQHNGLYWETKPGEPDSPLGPEFVKAQSEGYFAKSAADTGPRPFRGYYFRILTAQGPSAPGGARSYLANGKMSGGFAVVAWPVDYGNSGIMTFLVSHRGVLYQNDLGEKTSQLASDMSAFNPDADWEIVP